MKSPLLLLVFSAAGLSCNDRNDNSDTNIVQIKKVSIAGNSILQHNPDAAIGLHGDWGMAASAKDSDFVHLLIKDILQSDPSVQVKFKNIGDFERNFTSFDLSRLDSLKDPDLLILRIAENVDDKIAIDSNFILYYDQMINYLDSGNTAIKIITGGFWKTQLTDSLLKDYARKKGYPFIDLSTLISDSTNMAIGKFKNAGVAAHPSDKGMRMIEMKIWDRIKVYFEK